MKTTKVDVSPEALATLEALLSHRTRRAAAKSLGIGYSTLMQRLRESPQILESLVEVYRDNLRATQGTVQRGAAKAAKFLIAALDDKDAPYPSRVSAAFKLLDLSIDLAKLNDFGVRLEQVEQTIADSGIVK